MRISSNLFSVALLVFLFSTVSLAQDQSQDQSSDLTELSLEDLMNLRVTSVSKQEKKLSDAAAAVYVITQEDLMRSGASSVPEALRMVPGVDVAQIDANKWSIGTRGFNGRFANKLLVLIDGRSVYTPLFSGVFWDAQDLDLEDIERIEVIRGPGATLWGANAVNGVINIITKEAKGTHGGLLAGGLGSEALGFGTFRYGGVLNEATHFRLYAKGFKWDDAHSITGLSASDNWHSFRTGYRVDWLTPDETNAITFQGDAYQGEVHQVLHKASMSAPYVQSLIDTNTISGANALARWTHKFSEESNLKLQFYFDHTVRDNALLKEVRNTYDIDLQHSFSPVHRHAVIWGLGHRFSNDAITGSSTVRFSSYRRSDRLSNMFIQDELAVVESTLHVTLGSKFEYNDYTQLEIQPNARIVWTLHRDHRVWGALSRAVRTPSRAESDVEIDFAAYPDTTSGLTALLRLRGNPDFVSEKLTAYEVGYRYQPSDYLSIDLATFYNVYKNLRTAEPAGLPFLEAGAMPPYIVIPIQFDNKMDGETYGAELMASWHASNNWKLVGTYSWFGGDLRPRPQSQDASSRNGLGNSPEYKFSFRSYLNLTRSLEFDAMFYYVDRLLNQDIDSYMRLDTRIGLHATDFLDLSVTFQNALNATHREFGTTELGEEATEVQRSIYGKLTWRF